MKIKNGFLIILFLILVGCASGKKQLLPTNNKGGYFIKEQKTTSKEASNVLKISGRVYDVKTGNPISNAQLILGCYKTITSDNGEFLFKISTIHNVIPTFIETNFIGYKSIMTDIINTSNTNRIQIDFYLEEDSRPLGDCLGTINLKQID
jgi:hypothetical protein